MQKNKIKGFIQIGYPVRRQKRPLSQQGAAASVSKLQRWFSDRARLWSHEQLLRDVIIYLHYIE